MFSLQLIIKQSMIHQPIIFCFCLFTLTHSFVPSWGIHEWLTPKIPSTTPNFITISNPIHPQFYFAIDFPHRLNIIQNSYNHVLLKSSDQGFQLLVLNQPNNLHFMIINQKKARKKSIPMNLSIFRDSSLKSEQVDAIQQNIVEKTKEVCKILDDSVSKNSYFCSFKMQCNVSETLILNIFKNNKQSNYSYALREQESRKNHKNKIEQFMKHYGITNKAMSYQMVNYAVTSLLSSLCIHYDELDELNLGFCQKREIEYKFTPFVLKILNNYDRRLSEGLYEFYLSALQAKLYYPTTQQEHTNFKLIPQYLQTFTQQHRFKRESTLLNTIFVKQLLQKLTNLHQQLNYRQEKKLHPALKQMLTQPWLSSKNSRKPDYSQSFTEDFYSSYQSPYTLYHSTTKMNWLLKLYQVYYFLRISQVKKQALENKINEEQLFEERTLLQLLTKMFVADDSNIKVGEYLDIGQNQKNESLVYSKKCGYPNLLAYIYAEGGFPRRCLHELLSPLGIKSADQTISMSSSKYRYRGAVSAYFNLRLLPHIYKSLAKQPDLPPKEQQQIRRVLTAIWSQTQNFIQKVYHRKKRIYTTWSEDSEGLQSITWLRIVSVLFLGDLPMISKL